MGQLLAKPFLLRFFAGLLIFGALLFSFYERNLDEFHSPKRFIPKRHTLVPELIRTENTIFGWTDEESHVSFQTSNQTPIVSDKADQFVGAKILIGTGGAPKKILFELTITWEALRLHCFSDAEAFVRDNDWHTVFLSCKKESFGKIVAPTRIGESSSAALVDIKLRSSDHSKVAVYSSVRDENGQFSPAVQFIFSRYPNDSPPKSANERGFRRIFHWVTASQASLLNVCALLLVCFLSAAFATLTSTSFGFNLIQKKLSVIFFGIFFSFSLMFSVITPAFQNPDEPQHALGIVANSLDSLQTANLRQWFLKSAADARFLETSSSPLIPILRDSIPLDGFGQSDFTVNSENRSAFYSWSSKILLPHYYRVLKSSSEPEQLALWWLRLFLGFLPTLMAFIVFGLLLRLEQYSAAALFLLCLCNPVSNSLFTSVSNYGWAIIAGSSCLACLLAGQEGKGRLLFLFLAGALTPALVDSATPVTVLIYVIPIVALSQAIWASKFIVGCPPQPECSGDGGAGQIRKVGFFGFFAYPTGFILGMLILGDVWSLRLWPKMSGWFLSINGYIPFSHFPGVSEILLFCFSRPIVSVPALWATVFIVFKFLSRFLRQDSGRFECVHLRNILSLAVFSVFLGFAILLAILFRKPVFAPNIYGAGEGRPGFLAFLVECVEAFFSQFVNLEQDYFLWQSNFLAYGWLDTVAPQYFYFFLKIILSISVLASVVVFFRQTIPTLLLVTLPFLLGGAIWVVLLYGAWSQSHTLHGRYLLPAFGLFILPFFNALNLLFSTPETRGLRFIAPYFLILIFVVASFCGAFYLIPQRFLVGG